MLSEETVNTIVLVFESDATEFRSHYPPHSGQNANHYIITKPMLYGTMKTGLLLYLRFNVTRLENTLCNCECVVVIVNV